MIFAVLMAYIKMQMPCCQVFKPSKWVINGMLMFLAILMVAGNVHFPVEGHISFGKFMWFFQL